MQSMLLSSRHLLVDRDGSLRKVRPPMCVFLSDLWAREDSRPTQQPQLIVCVHGDAAALRDLVYFVCYLSGPFVVLLCQAAPQGGRARTSLNQTMLSRLLKVVWAVRRDGVGRAYMLHH